MKTCTKCGETKEFSEFSKDKAKKDGYSCWCKGCVKEYRQANKEKLNEYFKEYYQSNKEKVGEINKKYHQANKEKISEYKKEYYQSNREKISEINKKYRQANKEKISEYRKKYLQANKEKIAEKRKEYRQASRIKSFGQKKIGRLINSGKLIRPTTCSQCGVECKPDAHHDDYLKPFKVRFLCRGCHQQWHAKHGQAKNGHLSLDEVELIGNEFVIKAKNEAA